MDYSIVWRLQKINPFPYLRETIPPERSEPEMFTFVVTCYQQAEVIAMALESVADQITRYGQTGGSS